jgi:pantoate kinase
MARATRAFVPGHVTAFFSPHRHDEPARAGSTGAGLTLSDGVTVGFEPADESRVTLNGEPVDVAPVGRVLGSLSVTGQVTAESPLPLGVGFGVSGAMALGTALAATHALGGSRSENELVRLAHVAEVESNTGLGDVVAQARGGVPIRLRPGAPPHGSLDGIPAAGRIEYHSFGERSTEAVLSGDVAAIQTAGERAVEALRDRPTLPTLFSAGREFAREGELLQPRVERTIDDVQAAGGEAMMAMLGETVVALGTGLTDAGYDANSCEIHPPGARLLE